MSNRIVIDDGRKEFVIENCSRHEKTDFPMLEEIFLGVLVDLKGLEYNHLIAKVEYPAVGVTGYVFTKSAAVRNLLFDE